jgi:hypothetical protein
MFSNQTYTMYGDYGTNLSVLVVEIEFNRLIQEDESIFFERQKRDLLRLLVAVMLDLVPIRWP